MKRRDTSREPLRGGLAPLLVCLAVLCLWAPVPLFAAAVSWDGGGDGTSWEDAANWNPDGVPTASDDVTINVGGTPTIDHSTGSHSVNSLSCDELLVLSGGTIDIAAASTITTNGSLTLSGGTLSGTGTLTVNSTMSWSSGRMDGGGNTTIASGATLTISSGSNHDLYARTLTNQGTINYTGTGDLVVQNGVVDNQAGALIDLQTDQFFNDNGLSNTFTNAGTLRKSGGTGTSDFEGPIVFNNTGTVDVQTGTLSLSRTGTSTGAFTVSSGATLDFDGGGGTQNLNAGSSVTGAGNLTMGHGSSIVNIAGTYTIANTHITAGTLNFNAAASTTNLTLDGDNGVLGGTNTLTVNGSAAWSDGDMEDSGTTLIPSGVTLTISGTAARTIDNRTLTNQGTINYTGTGTLNVRLGATIDNQGLMDLQTDQIINHNGGTVTFNSSGTLRKSAGTGTSDLNGTTATYNFNNTGTVDIQTGTLSLPRSGTSTGAFSIASGATLTLDDSGTHDFNAGSSVSGAGSVTISGGASTTLNIAGTYSATTTHITSGTINFNADASTTNLTLDGNNGNLGGTNTLTVNGTAAWSDGDMEGSGTTLIASGATMTISGTNDRVIDDRTLSIAGTVNYTGTGQWTTQQGAAIAVQSGGVLDFQNDMFVNHNGGGATSITNTGTVRKSAGSGLTSFDTSTSFNNTGTIEVSSGTFRLNGFTNFSGTTLTGGTYTVSATFQFPSADIVTNAASITLDGSSAAIEDTGAGDGLANFATNNSGAAFEIKNGRNLTTAGALSNAGSVTIGSGSTLTVSGGANFTQTAGTTTVNGTLATTGLVDIQGGSLLGAGAVTSNTQNGGTVGPGTSAGKLDITGTYTQTSSGTLSIELGGTTAETQHDRLTVSGAATLDGTLNVSLINSFSPAKGDSFRVITFGSTSGSFATTSGLNLGGGSVLETTTASGGLDLLTRQVSESTTAAGISGAVSSAPGELVKVFSIGLTGDDVSTLSSIDLTLTDLTNATGLIASDLAELRLHRSSDASFDTGDTLLGTQTGITIGSTITVSASTSDTIPSTETYYLIVAKIGAAPGAGHSFRLGFAAGGVSTSVGSVGSAVTAADANAVTLGVLEESTTARGLSGLTYVPPETEVAVFRIGITGNGFSSVSSVTLTFSGVNGSSLAEDDIASALLYRSADNELDGDDTVLAELSSVTSGSAITLSGTSHTPADDVEVFYIVSVVTGSATGSAFRVGFDTGGVGTTAGGIGSGVSASDDDRVEVEEIADPQGVRLRIVSPENGEFAAIGDTVKAQVLVYRGMTRLDTVIVGMSEGPERSRFGNTGLIDTLYTPTGTGTGVDTFAVSFPISGGDVETAESGAILQALVSRTDRAGLQHLHSRLNLEAALGTPELGLVGDEVAIRIDGKRPVNSMIDSALIDTAALVNTAGSIFGTRATSDGPGGSQLVRSFRKDDELNAKLATSNLSGSGVTSARLLLVDALDANKQDTAGAYITVDFSAGDIATGLATVAFTAGSEQSNTQITGTFPATDNLRIKTIAYLIDEAGNLSANSTDADEPEAFAQDIIVVGDIRPPNIRIGHPQASGDRFTGRVDTAVAFVDSQANLDPSTIFSLNPIRFALDEGTTNRLLTVDADTALFGGTTSTDTLSYSVVDSFSVSTQAQSGVVVDLHITADDSVGNRSTLGIEDVILDQIAPSIADLSPASAAIDSSVINAITRHPSFNVNEAIDSVDVRFVRTDPGDQTLVRQSLLPEQDERSLNILVASELSDQGTYVFQTVVRDLAGNISVSLPDTFTFDSDFDYPLADSFLIELDTMRSVVDSTITGIPVWFEITAIDSALSTSAGTSRSAVTYASEVTIQATAGEQDLASIQFRGDGVTDTGAGSARLDAEGWTFGKRTIGVVSTTTADDIRITATGPHGNTNLQDTILGTRDGLTVTAGEFSTFLVNASDPEEPEGKIRGTFRVFAQPADKYGNPSAKAYTGDRSDTSATVLALLDTRIASDHIVSETLVRFYASHGGVRLPAGPHVLEPAGRWFIAEATGFAAEGVRIGVVSIGLESDRSGASYLQAVGSSQPLEVTPLLPSPETETGAPHRPDTLVVTDFRGADGRGDQGRYVVLSFPAPSGSERLSNYRVYREMTVTTALDDSGKLRETDPHTAFVPWAVLPSVDGPLVHGVIPALDNKLTRWAIAGEWGGPAVERDVWSRTKAAYTDAPQVPEGYILGWLERTERTGMLSKPGGLSSTDRTVSLPARAVDNIGPAPTTDFRVQPGDVGTTLSWTASADDQTVGSVTYRGYTLPIAGVEAYEVYRGSDPDTMERIARVPSGTRRFVDVDVTEDGPALYRVDTVDLDNRAEGELRAGFGIGVAVSGTRVYAGERGASFRVALRGADRVVGVEASFAYDPTLIENIRISPGGLAAGGALVSNAAAPGLIRIAYAGGGAVPLADGILLRVYFDIPETAQPGSHAVVTQASFSDASGKKLPVSVVEDGVLVIEPSTTADVILGSVTARPSESEVAIPIRLTQARSVAGGNLTLAYDASTFAYRGLTPGALALDADYALSAHETTPGRLRLAFASAEGPDHQSGTLATVHLSTTSNASLGTYPITPEVVRVVRSDGEALSPDVTHGSVSLSDGPGSVVVVGSTSSVTSGTVSLPIRVIDGHSVAGGSIRLTYDPKVLEFLNHDRGTGLPPDHIVTTGNITRGELDLHFAGPHSLDTKAVEIVLLTFAIPGDAHAGIYEVHASSADLRTVDAISVPLDGTRPGTIAVQDLRSADFNRDGTIDASDFLHLIPAFGSSQGDPEYRASLDLNRDATIDFGDLSLFNDALGSP